MYHTGPHSVRRRRGTHPDRQLRLVGQASWGFSWDRARIIRKSPDAIKIAQSFSSSTRSIECSTSLLVSRDSGRDVGCMQFTPMQKAGITECQAEARSRPPAPVKTTIATSMYSTTWRSDKFSWVRRVGRASLGFCTPVYFSEPYTNVAAQVTGAFKLVAVAFFGEHRPSQGLRAADARPGFTNVAEYVSASVRWRSNIVDARAIEFNKSKQGLKPVNVVNVHGSGTGSCPALTITDASPHTSF